MAKAFSGRPCSNASDINVSASEAKTAPPGKGQRDGGNLLAEHPGHPSSQHDGRGEHDRRRSR